MKKNKTYSEMLQQAVRKLSILRKKPSVGAVLGSGLGWKDFSGEKDIRSVVEIPYSSIPFMPQPSVSGHEGRLIFLEIGETSCAILSGRVHLYEGWDSLMVTFGVRALIQLGCKNFFLSNAAGAINPALRPGSLVLIKDHINLTGEDPTRGIKDASGSPIFTGLTDLYSDRLRKILRKEAKKEGIVLKEGIYACLKGPCYETPAEIRMLGILGADMVGMSTVLEAMAIRHGGGNVVAVSCITNLGAGIEGSNPDHGEVKQIASEASKKLFRIFKCFTRIINP